MLIFTWVDVLPAGVPERPVHAVPRDPEEDVSNSWGCGAVNHPVISAN